MKFSVGKALRLALFSALFLLSTLTSLAFAESPYSLSERLQKSLTKEGYKPYYQAMTGSDDGIFPHNIIISFENPLEHEVTDLHLNKVIFAFTQNYASAKYEELTQILDCAKELVETQQIDYSIEFAITANDLPQVPTYDKAPHLTGTAVYATSIADNDNLAAVVFMDRDITKGKKIRPLDTREIVPGGNGSTSPRYLLAKLIAAVKDSSLDYFIPPKAEFLYKYSLVSGDERVSNFLENNIPAAGIEISLSSDNLKLFKNIALRLTGIEDCSHEKNYVFTRLGLREIFIKEQTLVILYALFTLVCLCALIYMTFRKNRRTRQIRQDITKSWFIIPGVILITALIFELIELLTFDTSLSFTVILGIKLFVAMLIGTIIYSVQVKFHFGTSIESSRFLMYFTTSLSLYVFSFFDISLLMLFFELFLISFIGGFFKKKAMIIISTILMIAPFIPYLYALAEYADFNSLTKTRSFTFFSNCLFALIIYHFELGWSRILISLNIFSHHDQLKKRQDLIRIIVSTSVTTLMVLAAYVIYASSIQANKKLVRNSMPQITIQESAVQNVAVDFSRSKFAGLEMKHLIISTEQEAIRYIVSIECNDAAPIYGSNYEYVFDGENRIYFTLPDNPSGQLEIIFRSENIYDSKIYIESYYKMKGENSADTIFHEERSITLEKSE